MTRKVYLFQVLITLSLSALTLSCTPYVKPSDGESDVDFNGSDCIWIRSIRDYSPLDSQSLLIWGGANRPYFVRLITPARDMRMSYEMVVDSRDDRLCPYGGDGLIFGSFDPLPAKVRSIDRITKDQANELLVRYGKRDADEQRTPEPKEVEGPDVQELG